MDLVRAAASEAGAGSSLNVDVLCTVVHVSGPDSKTESTEGANEFDRKSEPDTTDLLSSTEDVIPAPKIVKKKRGLRKQIIENITQCPECSKTFLTKYILKEHLRIHSGERPFACYECGRTFTKVSNLKSHTLTHTGEKPFACNECSYVCSQRPYLRKHMLTHTGEKPFSCEECSYTCSQKSTLRRHALTHTGDKIFS